MSDCENERSKGRASSSSNNPDPVIRYAMRQGSLAWFRNLPIGSKLLTSFGLLFLLLGLSLAAILFYLTRINSYVERHQRITVPAIVTAADMRRRAFEMNLTLHRFLEHPSVGDRKDTQRRMDELASEIGRALEFYRSTHAVRTHPVLFRMLTKHGQVVLADEEDMVLTRIADTLSQLTSRWTKIISHDARSSRTDRRLFPSEVDILFHRLTDDLDALMNTHIKIDVEMKREGDLLVNRARLIALALVALLGIVLAATYGIVTTQVARPLKHLAATADRVARRDLSAHFEPRHTQDEVGRLTDSLRAMLGTLREQTRSLERKTRELESFTYSAAHDLKGPLREIEGFSTLLARNYSANLEPTAQHYLAMIQSSTLRLAVLIDDLLRYSRLEQQALPHSAINLRSMIDGVLAEQLRGVTPIPVIHIDLPSCGLRGEPASVRQAFINLIGNAIKFLRGVQQPEINIGGRATSGELIVWVKDNGIGFESGESERIFGLFERLHAPEDYEGTGVGLAIVKLIMEKHGGRAWAESSPGKGSTFYLAFPLSADSSHRAHQSSVPA